MSDIGKRLKSVRASLNFSQEQLAKELGITKQAVSNMETGKSSPALSTLEKLHNYHNININYLVSGVGDIFLTPQPSLRQSILNEVEMLLDTRGIK